jgi:hypothetical protein
MSTTSQIPFFGQAWELIITYTDANGVDQDLTVSTNAWEPESLRITFEIVQSTIPSPWWYADIVVYNLSQETINNIVLAATKVRLKAGFQTGPALSSVVWDGPIFQVLLDEENVIDTRVTLHCVANPISMANPVAFSIGPYAQQAQLLTQMAGNIGLPPMENSQNTATLSEHAQAALTAKQYPRGNTVFHTMGDYLDIVSSDQNLSTFRKGNAAYMTEIGNIGSGLATPAPDLIYALPTPIGTVASGLPAGTTQSIIGTPRQTPQGIIFTVLLDPRLKVTLPVQVVQLAGNLLITQQVIQVGQFQNPLNTLQFVVQVRHVGDSRGNDWYTEVTGCSTTFASNLLDGLLSATSPT